MTVTNFVEIRLFAFVKKSVKAKNTSLFKIGVFPPTCVIQHMGGDCSGSLCYIL